MKGILPALLLLVALSLAACTSEPETVEVEVEVTRIVEVTNNIEVTRVVEVPVTRIVRQDAVVTATPPPATTTPAIGSRSNPIPLNEVGNLVQTKENGDRIAYQFEVGPVYRGEEAYQRAIAASPSNVVPPAGQEYVMMNIRAVYTGPDAGLLQLSYRDIGIEVDGRIYGYQDVFDRACCLSQEFDFERPAGELYEGWIAWILPITEKPILLLVGSPEEGVYFEVTE
jgi:hypothetical protein